MLKIGDYYIQESAITKVRRFADDKAEINLVDGQEIMAGGPDAVAILAWLDNVSVHLDASTDEERAYAEYRSKGGELAKDDWRGLREEFRVLRGEGGVLVPPWQPERLVALKSLLLL